MLGWGSTSPTCKKLTRQTAFVNAYQQWVNAKTYLNWTPLFYKAYHYQKAGITGKLRVQLVEEHNLNGVVIFFDPTIGAENFTYLFELLKDRLLQVGYTLHSSDQHVTRHQRYTELIEKYFLTPPAADVAGTNLCNQLYGNILLDQVKVNGRPGYIRFVANAYADAFFSEPLPFNELLEKVLQPDEAPPVPDQK
ncbi:hypothetical protein [Pontibacter ruber]|uniref:Thioredoxin-like fold domain-containing protein n=1 Tax=Pontibacter ruber TaxID=1343895 RepID=A0ABW5CRY7_9BACT